MGLIGQTWTHRKVRRLLVLIDQNKHTKQTMVWRINTNTKTNVTVARVHYTVSDTTHTTRPGVLYVFVGGL